MVKAYRIVKEKFIDSAFDGEGAKLYGGRWNKKGTSIVYTSASPSLTVMENFIHLGISAKFIKHTILELEIPDNIIETYDSSTLPKMWKTNPVIGACQEVGTNWVGKKSSAVLAMPSVIIEMEMNYLLNPLHSDFKKIKVIKRTPFIYDERMWK